LIVMGLHIYYWLEVSRIWSNLTMPMIVIMTIEDFEKPN